MDTSGLALLRAVFIVGTSHLTSAGFTTNDIYGEIDSRIFNTETFPWQKLEIESESKSEKTSIPVWNNAVELKGCWANYYGRFKLSCGRMKNYDGVTYSHRAILHDHDEKRPLISWDVLSCDGKLLRSVSVVAGGGQADSHYYVYGVTKYRTCRMDEYRKGSEGWELDSKPNECPPPFTRTLSVNSKEFWNGWAINSIHEDAKDCR